MRYMRMAFLRLSEMHGRSLVERMVARYPSKKS